MPANAHEDNRFDIDDQQPDADQKSMAHDQFD